MTKKPLPYAHKGDLTHGPVPRHLVRMTVPMIWGLLAVISGQLANTYFVSLMRDTKILAGMSFTFPVTMLISHMVFGVNIALSSVVSRLIGAKDMEDTRRVVLHGLMMAFFISLVIALTTYVFLKPLFFALGADETTYPAISAYMPLWLVASVVLSLPVNANSVMRAAGDTAIPAMIMIGIAVINVVLDPILIFGLFGFPALGVQGASIATLTAYTAGLFPALYVLIGPKALMAVDGLHLGAFRDSMRRLLVIAIPAGIANIIQPASNMIILSIMAHYGSEAVAAYGVVTRVEAFAFLLVLAMSIGMAPIIGQNWGAEKYERVHRTIDLAIGFNLVWSLFMALVLGVSASSIGQEFSADSAVQHYVSMFLWIVPVSYGYGNLAFGWSSALNAMGKPREAFMLIFLKSFVFTIPAVYVGGLVGGIFGIVCGLALSNIVSGLMFHVMAERRYKGQAPAPEACEISPEEVAL